MTSTPKIVVSATLTRADWGPTTVLSGDVSSALARLKAQPGGDIAVGASGTLVRFLLREHLLDELDLLVHPVLAGPGKRLFDGGRGNTHLRLAQCRAHENGVVALRYTLAP